MRYGAAYLLAALSGSAPSAKDIEKILASVGVDCDAAQAKAIVAAMQGKDVNEVIAEGKFSSSCCLKQFLILQQHLKMVHTVFKINQKIKEK